MSQSLSTVCINSEFGDLKRVVIGLGAPYLRDKAQVAREITEFPLLPNTARRAQVLALEYPDEDLLVKEYADYVGLLEKYDVEILRADPAAAYSFDYTCPRDIGFVIGELFFIANMSVASRRDEIQTIQHYLDHIDPANILRPPRDCLLEGGDVILLDSSTILVGINQRSNRRGYEFLRDYLAPHGYRVLAVPHRQLHLDCCINPLGLGHLLIHRDSLVELDAETLQLLETLEWIAVDAVEREHLATNLLSINPATLVARDHPACRRVNQVLSGLGYRVESIGFDGVPATGGSFRCASLALNRSNPA